MKDIELYTFLPSQNAVRTEIALLEKGLNFKKIPLDLLKGEHKQPPLSEKSPRQQVPTLTCTVDGQPLTVYESIATIRFIDDMVSEPALMPPTSDVIARTTAIIRIEEFQAKLDPKNIFGSVVFRRMTKDQLADRIEALRKELKQWNKYLEGRTYLTGEQFTLADIAVFPLLMHFEVLGYDFEKETPALKAFMDACKARESVKNTGWIEYFTNFVAERTPELVLAS